MAPHNLKSSNRRIRTRTSGGVGGDPVLARQPSMTELVHFSDELLLIGVGGCSPLRLVSVCVGEQRVVQGLLVQD